MKKVFISIIAFIMVISAVLFFCYPLISNYVNSMQTDSIVMDYLDASLQLDEETYQEKYKLANEYNASLVGNVTVGDPFSVTEEENEFSSLLQLDETEAIAVIEIPELDVNLPVYYGTTNDILEKGVGLLKSSSLPVGGVATHAVLTGHTGYGGRKLFSDIDRLEEGDVFYIKCLGETLSYQVDNIATVSPDDTRLLEIDPQQDYVTLVTCTPYGVNTHRLLVRGTRISNETAKKITINNQYKLDSTWANQYHKALIAGLTVAVLIVAVFGLVRLILFIIRKRKKNENSDN